MAKHKQLTFPRPTIVTKIYPDGQEERIRYGYYESVMICKENGCSIAETVTLDPPTYPVIEVTCQDGSRLLFDKPWYFMAEALDKE